MTSPKPNNGEAQKDPSQAEMPQVSPAYSTPPPEGLPDADDQ